MNDILDRAESYFANDLRRSYWVNLSSAERESILNLAQIDVTNILKKQSRTCNLEDNNIVNAIFEQAIFLIIQNAILSQESILTSESVDGLGSRTFTPNKVDKEYYTKDKISPRTYDLLDNSQRKLQIIR